MPQPDKEVSSIQIQGLQAINHIEKIISKHVEFTYNDLDHADELREAIQIVRNDLANYNNVVRQHKIQKAQSEEKMGQGVPEVSDEPNVKPVKTSDEEGGDESE